MTTQIATIAKAIRSSLNINSSIKRTSPGSLYCQFCQCWALSSRLYNAAQQELSMNILHSSNLSFAVRFSVVLMLAINAACVSKSETGHEAAPPPATVVVAEVSQKTVPIYSEFVGQTRAEETVELRARVEGVLQKVYFREGSPVRKE